jgi:hypothetical protein
VAILTEFFVATFEQAALLGSGGPRGHVPSVVAKRVDPVKVASLYRIATAAEARIGSVEDPVDVARPNGPWLLVIKDEVTAALAAMADERITEIADAWAGTEEWQRDGVAPGHLRDLVGTIRDLARQADPPSVRLYLWMSL